MTRCFSPADERVKEAAFDNERLILRDESGAEIEAAAGQARELADIRVRLERVFSAERGFPEIERLNYVDGVRILFRNGDVAHVRSSGNADELRIYAAAGTQDRADEIARAGVAEPAGLLRLLEQSID
jgi:phosphomannomutase